MTDKELQKLGRRELLQLLLDQAKEAERLGRMLKETDEQLKQMEEGYGGRPAPGEGGCGHGQRRGI